MTNALRRWAWVPVPVLLVLIVGLRLANLQAVYESRGVMLLLNLVFTWLASLCIVILTARGFLASGQPGLLWFSCGSLLWGSTSLIAAGLVGSPINQPVSVHNTGMLAAAICHFIGMVWPGRLARPGRWLVAGYAGAVLATAGIVWAVTTDCLPLFFVQGQGGTPVRWVVLGWAVGLFATVAVQMLAKSRGPAGPFFYWYGLGLAVVATGLVGVLLLMVQGGLLGWASRLTQYLGSAYLFIAAMVAVHESGAWPLDLAAALADARESVRLSEERFRRLFDTMTEGFALHEIITDDQGQACDYRFLDLNPAFEQLTGLKRADLIGKRVREALPAIEAHWIANYGKVVQTGESVRVENHAAALGRWFEAFAYRTGPGQFAVVFSDITARKQAEAALQASVEHEREKAEELATLLEAVPAGVYIARDRDCRHLEGNRMADEILRVATGNELSLSGPPATRPNHFRPLKDGRELRLDELPAQRAARGERVQDFELTLAFNDGLRRHVLASGTPLLDQHGQPRGAVAIMVDITDRKQAEERIKASLAEKEVLLKEIHHRVKNNLQVIASLVSLQADGVTDARVLAEFAEVRGRVRAMALVHEALYQTPDLAKLNFADYAARLLEQLWHAHRAPVGTVTLKLAVAPVCLPVDTAVSCGLILNELASNTLKHAFPDGRSGQVTVGLDHDPATSAACLWVQDDGIGLPTAMDWRQSPSLGLRLVQMLAGQLRGTVATGTGPGTEFRVSFTLS